MGVALTANDGVCFGSSCIFRDATARDVACAIGLAGLLSQNALANVVDPRSDALASPDGFGFARFCRSFPAGEQAKAKPKEHEVLEDVDWLFVHLLFSYKLPWIPPTIWSGSPGWMP